MVFKETQNILCVTKNNTNMKYFQFEASVSVNLPHLKHHVADSESARKYTGQKHL